MQMLEIFVRVDGVPNLGASEHVERAGLDVDHGCGSNPYFRPDEWALNVIFGRNRYTPRLIQKTDQPEGRIARAICIEGVNAVVLGGDIKDIMRAFARHFDSWHEERLCVNRAVYLEGSEFAELPCVDILRSQGLLIERCPGPEVVVLRCGDLGYGRERSESKAHDAEAVGRHSHGRPHAVMEVSRLILDVVIGRGKAGQPKPGGLGGRGERGPRERTGKE